MKARRRFGFRVFGLTSRQALPWAGPLTKPETKRKPFVYLKFGMFRRSQDMSIFVRFVSVNKNDLLIPSYFLLATRYSRALLAPVISLSTPIHCLPYRTVPYRTVPYSYRVPVLSGDSAQRHKESVSQSVTPRSAGSNMHGVAWRDGRALHSRYSKDVMSVWAAADARQQNFRTYQSITRTSHTTTLEANSNFIGGIVTATPLSR